jgi:hypothetical protein
MERIKMAANDLHPFEHALGTAVVRLWAVTQELLFHEAAAGDNNLRESLAAFLHEKHPRAETPKHKLF